MIDTPVRIVLLTADSALERILRMGILQLEEGSSGDSRPEGDTPSVLASEVARQGRAYLGMLADRRFRLRVETFCHARDITSSSDITVCFIDSERLGGHHVDELESGANEIAARCGTSSQPVIIASPDAVFCRAGSDALRVFTANYAHLSTDRSELAAWAMGQVLDVIQTRVEYRAAEARDRTPTTLAAMLHRFMGERYFDRWTFSYLTGSPIAGFIGDLEELANESGAFCLRGSSEHSLAAGAFASWRVQGLPFVIAVTKGMLDEFKGTLANLSCSRARGFIVLVEEPPNTWFGAQSLITADEDVRDVLRARRIPFVYLHSPATLSTDMAQAVERFDQDLGPVVVFATPQVLGLRVPGAELQLEVFPQGSRPKGHASGSPTLAPSQIEGVLHAINTDVERMLWLAGGALTPKELEVLLDIGERAGIALANTAAAIGAVPHFYRGKPVRNLLGMLSPYSFNREIYEYLFANGRPNGTPVLGYLKSRITGSERPFSAQVLANDFHVMQVNDNPAHLAPFTKTAITGDLLQFLTAIRNRIAVPPALLETRRSRIEAAISAGAPGLVERQPSTPMTVNHFLWRLGQLLARLHVEREYRYRAVVGVSRFGFSAARNIPMVGLAHSGFYGRALMGDPLAALNALAFTTDANLVALVGDGERNLVPDILPSILENQLHGARKIRHNVTVFVSLNNCYSIMETFLSLSGGSGASGSRQARNVSLFPPDADFEIAGLRVVQRVLQGADEAFLTEAMTAPRRINVFPVLLAHNNSGDGMTLQSMLDWRYRGQ